MDWPSERRSHHSPRPQPSVVVHPRVRLTERVPPGTGADGDVFTGLRSSARCTRTGPCCACSAMRRTLFLVPIPDVPMIHAAASRAVARPSASGPSPARRRGRRPGPGEPARGAGGRRVGRGPGGGEATTAELTALDPRLGAEDDARARASRMRPRSASPRRSSSTSRSTAGSAAAGRAARGSAASSAGSPIERWLPDGIAAAGRRGAGRARPALAPSVRAGHARGRHVVDGLDGRGDRGRRWRRSRPSRWTSTAARSGYVLPDDVGTERRARAVGRAPARPRCHDDGLDARDWYLGPHRPALFDRNGNAGPTIWVDGRIVGGWAQRSDGEITRPTPRGRRSGDPAGHRSRIGSPR